MPVVHIPAALRALSGGRARVKVDGANLRQVLAALDRECPGLTARILDGADLRPDIAVAIDGSILDGGGLIQPVRADAEIYLVPPIGGGTLHKIESLLISSRPSSLSAGSSTRTMEGGDSRGALDHTPDRAVGAGDARERRTRNILSAKL